MFHPHHTPSVLVRRGVLGSLVAVLASAAIIAAPTHADELSWGVNPGGKETRSSFSFDMDPGEKHKDSFEITNFGTKDISLDVYAADGATSSNGSLELSDKAEASAEIGDWVNLEASEVFLHPGEKTTVRFSVDIPDDTAPGDYVGGLITSYADDSDSTVTVNRRLATQLSVRVEGEGSTSLTVSDLHATAPIAWNPFTPSQASISAAIANDGNLRARGAYTVKISGPFGLGSNSTSFTSDELLPGATVRQELEIPNFWPMIWQQVNVTMEVEGVDSVPVETVEESTTFWSVPAGWLVILLAVVTTAVVLGIRRSRSWEEDDEPLLDAASEVNS